MGFNSGFKGLNTTKPSVFILKQQCVLYQVGIGGGKVSLNKTINR